jgi:hypothetical protein
VAGALGVERTAQGFGKARLWSMCAKIAMSASKNRRWQGRAGMAKTYPCLPMAAKPKRLAQVGRVERPRRMLARYGGRGSRSWRSSSWTCDRPSRG